MSEPLTVGAQAHVYMDLCTQWLASPHQCLRESDSGVAGSQGLTERTCDREEGKPCVRDDLMIPSYTKLSTVIFISWWFKSLRDSREYRPLLLYSKWVMMTIFCPILRLTLCHQWSESFLYISDDLMFWASMWSMFLYGHFNLLCFHGLSPTVCSAFPSSWLSWPSSS